jgi:hypothetical protein
MEVLEKLEKGICVCLSNRAEMRGGECERTGAIVKIQFSEKSKEPSVLIPFSTLTAPSRIGGSSKSSRLHDETFDLGNGVRWKWSRKHQVT